jgi:hypothetical protein
MVIDLTHDPNISASALLAFVSALLIILIGMLGDAIATRLGRLNSNAVMGVQINNTLELGDDQTGESSVVYSMNRRMR